MSSLEHQSDIDTHAPFRTGRAALIGLILISGAAAAYVSLVPTDEEEPVTTTAAADPPPAQTGQRPSSPTPASPPDPVSIEG